MTFGFRGIHHINYLSYHLCVNLSLCFFCIIYVTIMSSEYDIESGYEAVECFGLNVFVVRYHKTANNVI